MELETAFHTSGEWGVFVIRGEVDLATAPQLERDIGEHVSEGCKLCLDLTGVSFMDSTGLRVLIGALKAVEEARGELHIVPGDGAVAKLLTITGLDERLAIYPSVDAATAS